MISSHPVPYCQSAQLTSRTEWAFSRNGEREASPRRLRRRRVESRRSARRREGAGGGTMNSIAEVLKGENTV